MEKKDIEVDSKDIKEIKINEANNTNKNVLLIVIAFLLGAILTAIFMNTALKDTTINKKVKTVNSTTVEESSDLKKGISNVYESVVYIEVTSKKSERSIFNSSSGSSGSGFVYKKDDKYGYILTNYHVIDTGDTFSITFSDGSSSEATLLGGDEYYDIAVLKVDAKSIKSVASIGDSSKVELGDTVFTVGAPLGKDYMGSITKGILSGTNRMVSVSLGSGSYMMEVIQTDASINSGNSGGPICNISGQVIGITSSKLVGTGVEGMGFAIPINSVMDIIASVESGKKIERPYLGIQVLDLSNTFALQYNYNINISDDVTFGAVVAYVESGKPADKGGLKVGDVIVSIDGEKIDDVSHFKYRLYKHKVGDKIKVKYYRNNKLSETTIELTEAIKSE